MIILGIDPGINGGCVFIHQDTDIISYFIGTDPYELTHAIKKNLNVCPIYAIIEKAQAFPKNGSSASFNYGTGFGKILGVLAAMSMPYSLVPPNVWTKEMLKGIPKNSKPKARCLQAFKQLYPKVDFKASARCKNHHDGLVDALLIAEYGRRQFVSQHLSPFAAQPSGSP